jgi:hypothetical protein
MMRTMNRSNASSTTTESAEPVTGDADVARLRAEVDQLRAELDDKHDRTVADQ